MHVLFCGNPTKIISPPPKKKSWSVIISLLCRLASLIGGLGSHGAHVVLHIGPHAELLLLLLLLLLRAQRSIEKGGARNCKHRDGMLLRFERGEGEGGGGERQFRKPQKGDHVRKSRPDI
jgi:hypothetical protein